MHAAPSASKSKKPSLSRSVIGQKRKRRRLFEEHRQQMSKLMENMRSSRGEMRMGMMGGGAKHGRDMPEGEKRRQHMIEKRIDMMENAMEMMMQRDEMMMH